MTCLLIIFWDIFVFLIEFSFFFISTLLQFILLYMSIPVELSLLVFLFLLVIGGKAYCSNQQNNLRGVSVLTCKIKFVWFCGQRSSSSFSLPQYYIDCIFLIELHFLYQFLWPSLWRKEKVLVLVFSLWNECWQKLFSHPVPQPFSLKETYRGLH